MLLHSILASIGSRNPFNAFTYDLDMVAGTVKGGTQPYGSNTNDGRLFRDPNNVVASFCPTTPTGSVLTSVSSAGLRRVAGVGQWVYPTLTNRALWNRDLTNAAWTKTNITATKNQTGAEGTASAATLLAATAANGTVTQAITLASGQVVYSVDIKRVSGSGNIDMTVDGGTSWTTITGLTGSYTQQFITQAAVLNPVIGIRIVTSGDSVAVDFNHLITPANSMNVPKKERVTTTTATVLNSQSRASADIADSGPLIGVAQGAFGFYWQGRSERATGGFIITGATNLFCQVLAGGAVKFSDGPGGSQTTTGIWRTGLSSVNKVAGYVTAGGAIKMACNGTLGGAGTGATLETALDHFDLGTNGAGQNSIYGINERFAMGTGLTFTDAELIAMTT